MKKSFNREEYILELRKKRLTLEHEMTTINSLIDMLKHRNDQILYSIDEINLRINNN
jgi:hypothetical protein